MPNDTWGLKKIYPLKTGGWEWYQPDDITKSGNFEGSGDVTNSSGGTWTMDTSGPTSVDIGKNNCCDQTVTGGCNMNFDEIADRGYGFKSDDPRDIELKFLVKFVSSESDNGFAVEGPTGSHSGSTCCSGYAYKFDIRYRDDPPEFRYRKEMYHASNSDDPKTGKWTNSKFNFQLLGHSSYVGFAYIRYNKVDGAKGTGHNTDDSVILEVWGNTHPDTDGEDWFLMKRTEDKGGWGDGGDQCDGDDDQIGSFSMPKFRLKSNDSGGVFQFKHVSLREINPTGSFTDNPDNQGGGGTDNPNTNTGEITGILASRYDINVLRSSPCSPGGSVRFYSAGQDGGEYSLSDPDNNNRNRIGMRLDTGSPDIGKKVIETDYYLYKVGSPTGTATATIRNSIGTLKATLGTLDVSTLTGSFVKYTFINLSNTYLTVVGNYISIEYDDGTSGNYVNVATRSTKVATDNTTVAVYHKEGEGNVWYTIGTNSEVAGEWWEE